MGKITSKVYRLGGLTIASELDLPGLPPAQAHPIDVVIRIGHPPKLEDAREVEPRCLANDLEYLHTFPEVASFYIRGGEEIIVHPFDLNRLDEIRSLLHSQIFAVLFSRRGLLPLHASAVSVDGKVFGFLGRSGAGKSSLVAYLSRRGYQVVADDLTLLNRTHQGVTEVTPCGLWLKLWRDTLDALGEPVKGLETIAGKNSKYRFPLTTGPTDPEESLPLAGLFVLESTAGEEVLISPLEPAAAVAKLMLYSYPILLIHRLGGNAELFHQCGEILEKVPMWTFTRPWNLGSIEKSVDTLQAHLAAINVASL